MIWGLVQPNHLSHDAVRAVMIEMDRKASLAHRMQRSTGGAVSTESEVEGGRARVEQGLSYRFAKQGLFQVETFYDGIGLSNYESYGIEIGQDLKF